MLMVAVVMFFAFSCLFTLSPENMADAKAQNIPVLSYLANHFAPCPAQIDLRNGTGVRRIDYRPGRYLQIVLRPLSRYPGRLNGLVLKFGYKGDKTKVYPQAQHHQHGLHYGFHLGGGLCQPEYPRPD
jgi:hypothetical protein